MTTASWCLPAADHRPAINGEDYDRPFRERELAGVDVHGEARFVSSFRPGRVLDAGCGTGRVAIELARLGMRVTGVDADPGMLAAARRKSSDVEWIEADLAAVQLRDGTAGLRQFDLIVLAGNVMIFLAPGTEGLVTANLARHLAPGGLVVAGFQLIPGGLTPASHEAFGRLAGLDVAGRWAGWSREPWDAAGGYVVSALRR